jgi:transposase
MLQVTAQSKIFLAIQPIDFRKGIDSIAALCKQKLEIDPMNGALFVFRNRLQTTLKILCYDGQGFWLCIKRLSSGKFKWWPKNNANIDAINYRILQTLLYNGNPNTAGFPEDWRPLPN